MRVGTGMVESILRSHVVAMGAVVGVNTPGVAVVRVVRMVRTRMVMIICGRCGDDKKVT